MKQKILVINNDAAVRASVQRLLNVQGLDTVLTNSGEEGLKLLEQLTPDLILLDVTLPGMDGLVILSQLHEKFPALKVVMLATSKDTAKAHQALTCGAGDFISIPVDLPALKRVLQMQLGLKP